MELLVSVGLVAAVAGTLCFLAMKWLGGDRLENGGEMVASMVSYAQQQAISENKNCYVQIDKGTPDAYVYFDPFSKEVFTLPDGLVFDYVDINPAVFYFNYLGTPSTGCTIAIKDLNSQSKIYIVVAAVTGRVRISEVHP